MTWTLDVVRDKTKGFIHPCKYEWVLRREGQQIDHGYSTARWTARLWASRVRRRWLKNTERKKGVYSYEFGGYDGEWFPVKKP